MSSRTRAVLRRGLLLFGLGVSVLCVLLVVGVISDDREITVHEGTAIADVLAAGPRSASVTFTTADGVTRAPALGVIYPRGLAEGQRVEVEYSTVNPELVRVAGRNWTQALVPVGILLTVTWGLVALSRYLLRRRVHADSSPPDAATVVP